MRVSFDAEGPFFFFHVVLLVSWQAYVLFSSEEGE